MEEDLISVVIPVYNVECYLNRCIESIINQNYSKLQIILIDDGSSDGSGEICDQYKQRDNRITVIHKKNGGLSNARNVGIDEAKGEYITFIDSDDYVEVDYIRYLYGLIKKYNTKMSVCRCNVFIDDKGSKDDIRQDKCYKKLDLLKDILYANKFDVSAWGKLYYTKHFKDVRYPEGKFFEDNETTYKIIEKNDIIAAGYEKKYNYIIRKSSITQREFCEKHLYLINAVDKMCNDLEKYVFLKKAIKRKRFWARISTLNRMINSKTRNFENEKNMRKEILNFYSVLFDFESSIRDRCALIFLFFGVNIYKKTWNFYEKITRRK